MPGIVCLSAIIAAVPIGIALFWRRLGFRMRSGRGENRQLADCWTNVDGVRIYSRASTMAARQSQTPVVLVHGFMISGSYFLPTAERLASEFVVYVPELPGHGHSDTPAEALDIGQLADALMGWMSAMGIPKAAFVANSMGCQVVVDLAVKYPQRVDRLVLVAPAIDPAARTVWQHLPRVLFDVFYERLSLAALVTRGALRMRWRAVRELRHMMNYRIEEKLPRVTLPTMLVRGENDAIVPQVWFDEAARLARAEEVAVIPGWGHAVNYSAPEELVDAFTDFLRREVPGNGPRS